MKLPQYTKKDIWIFLGIMPPLVVMLNFLLYGKRLFTELPVFVFAGIVTGIILTIVWQCLTWVAVTVRNRFNKDGDLIRRMVLAMFLIILISELSLTIIFLGYDYFHFMGYELNETSYQWSLGIMAIINIFVTLLHEGVSGFEKWKATLIETEQLKKEYMQSQLLGLKSQVNPHFLFNSLNSLSSLIIEDPKQAEKFLDELSKVYRYLLRNSDDQLVEVEVELQFIQSYFYLLKARYGDGVELLIDVDDDQKKKCLPPLTLQILLESAFNLNAISKSRPLKVEIATTEEGWLQIKNNIEKKLAGEADTDKKGITNIANKFRLLCQQSLIIKDIGTHRIMQVPLIPNTETVTV
jgi:two-component system, LytTR family, sensor kinase